ncbi:MAG: putative PEP-binding protein, partial [Balneolaceae bacterium]
VESQLQKASQVLRRIENQLRELQDTQRDREILEILDAQVQIIKDPELYNRVRQLIEQEQRSAEYALFRAFNEFIQLLRQTGQEWVKDRIIDLQSLRDKIIQQISGSDALQSLARGSIIFAEELSPTEVIEFSELEISAIVMQHGGTTSHSVIIAQSLGIPCVVGVNWRRSQLDGVDLAAIDAGRGEVIINPDEQMLSDFRGRREEAEAVDKNLIRISRLPSRTSCGSVFHLRANIEFEEELLRVRNYRAEGIGLLRTETLFLRQGYFDVKQHVLFYRNVLSGTGGHMVTVRLLDVGGDKLPGKRLEEPNPFLGWRGIRMLLDEEKLLNDQIEAILTVASEFPDRIRILMPMVSNVSEIIEVKRRIAGVRDRLNREGIPAPEIPAGIMIEV